jgi:hypothetical protein
VLSEYKGNWSSVFDIAAYSSVHQGWYADDDTGAITGDKKVGTLYMRYDMPAAWQHAHPIPREASAIGPCNVALRRRIGRGPLV